MEKRTSKRIQVLRARLLTLRQHLAGAKQQCDDPDEVVRLEQEISAAATQLERLVSLR